MPDTKELFELHGRHSAGQDKYTYFLLTAAASGIALAVAKTDGTLISWWLGPVAGATNCWALSFFVGCRQLHWVQACVYANYNYLSLPLGVHPGQPPSPALLEAALRGVDKAMGHNGKKAVFYGEWQFRLLVAGAVFFIAWRLTEMIRATIHAT